jgi:hypothetical protein
MTTRLAAIMAILISIAVAVVEFTSVPEVVLAGKM